MKPTKEQEEAVAEIKRLLKDNGLQIEVKPQVLITIKQDDK